MRIARVRSTMARMSEASLDGAMCVPNITGPGRKRRRNVAMVMLAVGIASLVLAIVFGVGPYARALVGLPFAAAAATYLQVTRNTCVAHARAGTVEHDDFSTSPAPADQSAASKRVANTILRDAALVGASTAALAFASAYLV